MPNEAVEKYKTQNTPWPLFDFSKSYQPLHRFSCLCLFDGYSSISPYRALTSLNSHFVSACQAHCSISVFFQSFSILCTIQYSSHCAVALASPRKLILFSLLLLQILPNTGSIVHMRRLYIFLPASLSIFRFIKSR